MVASSFGKKYINKGDEILVTELEHHSNYVPWHYLRSEKGAVIKFAQVNSDGDVEIDEIKKQITNKTKIIAITHISNVTGAVLPITKIVDLAKERNIPVLIDGTQGAPHSHIDMQKIGCDFYAISCHKMYGPNGLGILYMKKKWVDDLPPYQGGGGMIDEVKQDSITFAEEHTKFEAGTMQTAEVVSFAEALNFIEKIGIKNIASHENEVLEYGLEKLRKNNSVNIIGSPKNRGSVLCFTIKDIHPHDIATILDDDGVAIRAGHHCCQILHDKLGIAATARASIGVYNDKEDIDKLISEAEKKENDSNHIQDFTKNIKNMDKEKKIEVIKNIWSIILSDGTSDIYEENLMRRLAGLLYLDSKTMGDIKLSIEKNLQK